MNNSIFETKEQYLAFRSAFAAAVNDQRAKHYYTDHTRTFKTTTYAIKMRHSGWVQAEHFVLLNLLRGKPADYGFNPITKKSKLAAGMRPMGAVADALQIIGYAKADAVAIKDGFKYEPTAWGVRHLLRINDSEEREAVRGKWAREAFEFRTQWISRLLAPFNGTITPDQLADLQIEEYDNENNI